jgi:hypothetical protein
MRNRIARLGVVTSAVVALSVPLSTPAHAWSCMDVYGKVLCLVVGTTCRTYGEVTGNGEICQLG